MCCSDGDKNMTDKKLWRENATQVDLDNKHKLMKMLINQLPEDKRTEAVENLNQLVRSRNATTGGHHVGHSN